MEKRFGFVRFNEVEDERMLTIRLDDTFIDYKKIVKVGKKRKSLIEAGGAKMIQRV